MTPNLIIRLPEHADQPVHWQLWPAQEGSTEPSASSHGSLPSIADLAELADRFRDRTVIILVPGSQVNLHKLTVTGKITQAVLQSLPWRLEDELSEDVDNLHFTVFAKSKINDTESDEEETLLHIAVVADRQMQTWQAWLEQAGISSKKWLPDALTIPVKDDNCSILAIDDHLLIRHGLFEFGSCDLSWLDLYLETLASDSDTLLFEALNPINSTRVIQPVESARPPLSFLAPEAIANSTNLLQGKWKQASPWLQKIKPWRSVATLLLITLMVTGGQSLLTSIKLEQQASAMQEEAKNIYRSLFPGERIQVVHKQMRQKLTALQSSGESQNGLLETMTALQPLFTAFPDLKPVRLDYESSRNTLRIEASAKDFDTFTRFRDQSGETMASDFTISVDAVERSSKDSVTGTLIISGKAA